MVAPCRGTGQQSPAPAGLSIFVRPVLLMALSVGGRTVAVRRLLRSFIYRAKPRDFT